MLIDSFFFSSEPSISGGLLVWHQPINNLRAALRKKNNVFECANGYCDKLEEKTALKKCERMKAVGSERNEKGKETKEVVKKGKREARKGKG